MGKKIGNTSERSHIIDIENRREMCHFSEVDHILSVALIVKIYSAFHTKSIKVW